MVVTNVSDAKAQLSALLERVRNGEVIILGKAGRPVAKLIPYDEETEPRQPGALRGMIRIADDFDDLPPEIAVAFGMDG